MKYTPTVLALLGLAGSAHAATVAQWSFEEGTPGVQHTEINDGFYEDTSGNNYHLSASAADENPTATGDLPFADQSGTTNLVALDFDGIDDHLETTGAINSLMFTNGWTIESTFKVEGFKWEVLMEKDGQGGDLGGTTNSLAPFWLKVFDSTHQLEALAISDNDTDIHAVQTLEPLLQDRWYSVAVTYDNSAMSLYLKQEDGGDYVLQGTAIATNGISFGLWDSPWTIGRGMWDGNPLDEFNGIIDEVRISDVALTTNQFINQDGFTDRPFAIWTPSDVATSGFSGFDQPITLTASAYESPAAYAFTGSAWQVSTSASDFSSPIWTGTTGGVETITIPANTLTSGNTYYGRVQYQSEGGASEWSEADELILTIPMTVAHWRFEEGATGTGDTGTHTADWDAHYLDISGNGNHMSSWPLDAPHANRPLYTDAVPFSPISGIGANELALDLSGGPQDIGTFGANTGGKMIDAYAFTAGWTIEATFQLTALDVPQIIMGKDGRRGDLGGAVGPEPPFWFKILPWNNHLEVLCLDDTDTARWTGSLAPLVTGEWYSAVARYDGAGMDLWLKGPGDTEYVFQSAALFTEGVSLGEYFGAGVLNEGSWSIGRGAWDGNPVDNLNGFVDEVRITNYVLDPSEFLRAADSLPPIGNIAMVTVTDGLDLTWTTSSDYTYALLEKQNLTAPTWTTNGGIVGGADSVTVTVPTTNSATAFYKVISE